MKEYAPTVLRIGLSCVVIWFGFSQLTNPTMWTSMVPLYATALVPIPVSILVLGNAIFELLFGFALLLGLYTRFVAGILTLHLAHIVTIVGYNAIGVRDFGLTLAMLAVFLHGPSRYSIDSAQGSLVQGDVK